MTKHHFKPPQTSWAAFIAVFCVFAIVLSSLSTYITSAIQREKIENTYFEEASATLDTITELVDERFAQQRQQVHFLHATLPTQGMYRASNESQMDVLDSSSRDQWIHRLKTIFVAFLESNPYIVKAAYVDVANDGKEILRVERQQGDVIAVEEVMLRHRKHEAYYNEVLALPPNAVYTSNIRLNREFGRIEFPTWSTYKIAKAVFDDNGEVVGFLILSFYADHLLTQIRLVGDRHQSIYLLNSSGGFLVHPNNKYEFGFEIGDSSFWEHLFKEKGIYSADYVEPIYQSVAQDETVYFLEREILLDWPGSGRIVKPIVALPELVITKELKGVQWFYTWVTLCTIIIVFASVLYYRYRISCELSKNIREAEFEAIFLGSRDAIISLDVKGRIKSWNPSAEGMFQYGESYAMGKSVFNLIFDTDNQVFNQETLEDIVNGIQVKPMDTVAHDKNLNPLQVEVTLSAIIDETRGVQSIAAFVRNIIERKRYEEKIISLNETLEQRVEERTLELKHARDEAQKASKSKSSFIANVSHEIRTPMNGVLGMLSLMKRGEMPEKQRRLLKSAESSAQSLTILINDLLDISKIESGNIQFEHRAYNLVSLVNDVASSICINAFEKGVDFVVDCSSVQHEWLLGDQSRVRQVLYNLVGNAIKYTRQGVVEFSIATRRIDSKFAEIEFNVRDTGVGISVENMEEIFEAFSRINTASSLYATRDNNVCGTGLGLTISKKLCQKMGGNITVKSEKDKGSLFVATLKSEISVQHLPTFNVLDLQEYKVLILHGDDDSWKAIHKQLAAWGVDDITFENISDYARITSRSWFDYVIINSSKNYAENFTAATYLLKSNVVQNKENVIILTPVNATYDGGNVFTELTKPVNPFILWAKLKGEEPPVLKSGLSQVSKDLLPVDLSSSPVYTSEALSDTSTVDSSDLPLGEAISTFGEKSKNCVLIVDDTQINIDVAEGMLEDFGVETQCATSGKEAIACLKEAPKIDVVLMDCQMPGMDGLETTAKIRSGKAGAKHQFVPIVAITANAMKGSEDGCLSAGMNDYLTKPIDPDRLKAVLAKYIQQPKPALVKTDVMGRRVPPKAKLWEKTDLLRKLKGRDDRTILLIKAFIATASKHIREIQMQMNQIKSQDVDNIQSLVNHVLLSLDSLNGSSANIGAKRLYLLGVDLENLIQEGGFDDAHKAVEALCDVMDETFDNMKIFVNDFGVNCSDVVNEHVTDSK